MSNSVEKVKKSRKPGGTKTEQNDDGKTCLGEGVLPVAGGVFKSAAVAVLRVERRLMSTGEICRVALERGLIKCQGKTPEATMASALYTDVKRKADKSCFTRPQEGLFGLREWIAEGFFPEGWVAPADGSGVAPAKRRRGGGRGRGGRGRGAGSVRKTSPGTDVEMEDVEESEESEEEESVDVGDEEDDVGTETPKDRDSDLRSTRPAVVPLVTQGSQGAAVTPAVAVAVTTVPVVAPIVTVAATPPPPAVVPTPAPAAATPAPAPTPAAQAPAAGTSAGGGSDGPGSGSGRGPPSAATASRLALPDLGDLPGGKDDLDSPLHVLGDAVLTAQARKRERPAFVQVPERNATVTLTGMSMGDGSATPRSPYEDSLAALHEIATSPNPYAASGIIDTTDRRRKPRLLLDVSDRPEGQPSPRLASGGGRPPGLIVDVSLPTPAGGFINTPAIMAIPDILPSVRGAGQGGAGGSLFSPGTMLQISSLQTNTIPLPPGVSSMERLEAHPPPIGSSGQDLQGGGLLPMPRPLDLGGSTQGGPHPDAPTGPPQLLEAIQVQAATERLASKLGPSHPQIPRAWLAVARLFQALGPAGGPEAVSRAAAALNHVRETCHAMAQAAGSTVQPACDSALSYLLERTGQQGGLGTA